MGTSFLGESEGWGSKPAGMALGPGRCSQGYGVGAWTLFTTVLYFIFSLAIEACQVVGLCTFLKSFGSIVFVFCFTVSFHYVTLLW